MKDRNDEASDLTQVEWEPTHDEYQRPLPTERGQLARLLHDEYPKHRYHNEPVCHRKPSKCSFYLNAYAAADAIMASDWFRSVRATVLREAADIAVDCANRTEDYVKDKGCRWVANEIRARADDIEAGR